ncbi:MAG: fibronectin type III domain-containing protein, partial [Bacteroidota bacterium]
SVWSFETQIELDGDPELISPMNNSADLSLTGITFDWSSFAGAIEYVVEYDTASDFSTAVSQTVDASELGLPTLDEATTYYWRVQANNDISETAWSEVWQFTTAESLNNGPFLSSPANNADPVPYLNLILTWEELSGADSYILQYSQSNAFLDPMEVEVGGPSYEISTLDPLTTYYWRVRGVNSVGNGPFSEVWNFTTDTDISISELTDGFFLELFPNPTSGKVVLKSEQPIESVKVYNSFGQEFFCVLRKISDTEVFFSTDQLASGSYVVLVQSSDQQVFRRLIKE